ncbi:hypothetical protein DFH09DRAFT_1422570 [Mycena vulgaris]|nr:hypothetical protein DFH09DRAFT_1422570 [Mycena vulgaris]
MILSPLAGARLVRSRLFHLRRWDSPARHYSSEPNPENVSTKILSISTLNPWLLKSTDYIDVSRMNAILDFPASSRPPVELSYGRAGQFPDHARGFFYYYSHPPAGSLEGGLRMRITPDSDPASFPGGQDLEWMGLPWQIPLVRVACHTRFAALCAHLAREDLVTEAQILWCRHLFRDGKPVPGALIHRLDSPFLFTFGEPVRLCFLGELRRGLELGSLSRVCGCADPSRGRYHSDWTGASHDAPRSLTLNVARPGSAVVRFERATLPGTEDRPVLHLRILKIVKPVACTVNPLAYVGTLVQPEEGALLKVRNRRGLVYAWEHKVDTGRTYDDATIRDLWNSTGEPPRWLAR